MPSAKNAKNEIKNPVNQDNKSIKLKPQAKHLRTRVDYLIKVMQNQINIEKYGPEWKEKQIVNKSSKSRKKPPNNIENDFNQNDNTEVNSVNTSVSKLVKKKSTLKEVDAKNSLSQKSLKKSKRKLDHDHLSKSGHHDSNDSDNSESNSDTKVKICNLLFVI